MSMNKSLSTYFKRIRYFFKWHTFSIDMECVCICTQTYLNSILTFLDTGHIRRISAQSSSNRLSLKNNNIGVVLLILPLLHFLPSGSLTVVQV